MTSQPADDDVPTGRRSHTEQMVTVNGQSIWVVTNPAELAPLPGAEPRPPLLICNGIGAALGVLDAFVDLLEPQQTVIRFDPPGVGGSPTPKKPYRLPGLARLMTAVLDELGHRRFDLLGYSWGGGLAQQIAVQNPRRCRRLVLVATSTGSLMAPSNPLIARNLLRVDKFHQPGYAAGLAGDAYGGSARDAKGSVREMLALQKVSTSARGYAYQLMAAAGWTSIAYLPLIRQPTLVLAGDDDPIIPPANRKIFGTLMHNVTLQTYPGGHIELIAQPHLFHGPVEDFLHG